MNPSFPFFLLKLACWLNPIMSHHLEKDLDVKRRSAFPYFHHLYISHPFQSSILCTMISLNTFQTSLMPISLSLCHDAIELLPISLRPCLVPRNWDELESNLIMKWEALSRYWFQLIVSKQDLAPPVRQHLVCLKNLLKVRLTFPSSKTFSTLMSSLEQMS